MTTELPQGDLRLLGTDLARQMLTSNLYARLGLIWTDGRPRVVPTWFHWTGQEVVMTTYLAGPAVGVRHPARRVTALRANPNVEISIGTDDIQPRAISIRGRACIAEVDGVADEYALAAKRYLGEKAATSLLQSAALPGTRQARIAVRPTWVGLLDFQTRLPSPLGGVL
ncbi:pyridoxamine 5'-phosphate oxidase family protein [Nocardia carnea]|uniref:pyridoxamine 5'-phosphate oxidase family protein n=1 Tax=Nocardia carnea TaxID=37328 RepID=UPI002458EB6E|nr:pyridoxamine 5'-phosphate oxidase family protein [Nocardia carnea]